ncbi:hypothetical protein FRC06_009480 [Ceratobasidium sp. 370]|nr:hypothetical protein FRC06_009480 [Ceratobasidium sp. 370]
MSTTLPPWDSLGFSFGTEPEVLNSVAQCANVTFDYYNTIDINKIANPPPTAPYSVVIYGGGAQPLSIPLNNSATSGQYKWRVNLPAGQSYAVSMKDAKGYTGGILTPTVKVTPGTASCNPGASPMKPPSLDVSVSGSSQCGQAVVAVNNGTAPYTIELVPADNRQQKTIHFAASPFNVVLDISAGVDYFLAVYDSAGHSTVKGMYTIASSSDNSCLGAATTVTAGMFSTLYPGGTASATVSPTAAPANASSGKLASGAVIGIAVAIPVAAIILILLALWFCYRRNRRQKLRNAGEKPEIDQFDPPEPRAQGGYTPVATAYFGSGPTNSYHDLSSASGSQHPLAAAGYGPADRQTIISESATSSSGAPPSSMGMSEKRRHLLNPDSHGLGPTASEPFDPYRSGAGGQPSQPRMPPLPPAYAPSPGHP